MPYEDPVDFMVEHNHGPCPFHALAPGEPWAGCTCSGGYSRRRATPEEREQNIKSRDRRQSRISKALNAMGIFLVLWMFTNCAASPALSTAGTVLGAAGGVTLYKKVTESGPKFAPEFVLFKIVNCQSYEAPTPATK